MRVANALDVRGQNLNARSGLAAVSAQKKIECAKKKIERELRAKWNHQDEKMLGSKDH